MFTILLTKQIQNLLPFLLAFAAGAMVFVIIEELVPESSGGEDSDMGTIGFAVGFTIMMILDVALGNFFSRGFFFVQAAIYCI